jgi:hypothetical protein
VTVIILVAVGEEGFLLRGKAGHSLASNILIVVILLDSALREFSVGGKVAEA